MAGSELRTWVSDRLHDVIGLSERNVVDYLMACAKKADSPQALISMVESGGMDVTPDLRAFTDDLWQRLPHAAALPMVQRPSAVHNRQLLAERVKNASYKLLESSDDDGDATAKAAAKREESKQDKKRRKHRRRKDEESSSSDSAAKHAPSKRKAGTACMISSESGLL